MNLMDELEEEYGYRNSPEYWVEYVMLGVGEQLARWMQERGVTRAKLGRRLGKSRPYVTKLLSGRPNMTVETLVRVGLALGVRPDLRLVDKESSRALEPLEGPPTAPRARGKFAPPTLVDAAIP